MVFPVGWTTMIDTFEEWESVDDEMNPKAFKQCKKESNLKNCLFFLVVAAPLRISVAFAACTRGQGDYCCFFYGH